MDNNNCSKCGKTMQEESTFCDGCGKRKAKPRKKAMSGRKVKLIAGLAVAGVLIGSGTAWSLSDDTAMRQDCMKNLLPNLYAGTDITTADVLGRTTTTDSGELTEVGALATSNGSDLMDAIDIELEKRTFSISLNVINYRSGLQSLKSQWVDVKAGVEGIQESELGRAFTVSRAKYSATLVDDKEWHRMITNIMLSMGTSILNLDHVPAAWTAKENAFRARESSLLNKLSGLTKKIEAGADYKSLQKRIDAFGKTGEAVAKVCKG